MIAIDNVLFSDEIIEEQFVCDLNKCKGGCCEDGDAGAPLDKNELPELDKAYSIVKPYLTPAGIAEIEKNGRYQYSQEFGYITPTIEGGLCAYGLKDSKGIIKCGIEQAYLDGKISWKKPISCHLFPIRIKKTRSFVNVNYEPRETLCAPACEFGKKLKVPVFVFLKEAITRRFGEEIYTVLEQVAESQKERRKNSPQNKKETQ